VNILKGKISSRK